MVCHLLRLKNFRDKLLYIKLRSNPDINTTAESFKHVPIQYSLPLINYYELSSTVEWKMSQ